MLVPAYADWINSVISGTDKLWQSSVVIGTFADGGNWAGAVAPAAFDTVVFDDSSTHDISFDSTGPNQRLIVRNGNVIFNLDGFTRELTLSSPSITVGENAGDNATLTLRDGMVAGIDATIGRKSNSVGRVVVGTDAVLDLHEGLHIGAGGEGSLTINGTVMSGAGYISGSSSGDGHVEVNGQDAEWTTGYLEVGKRGMGSLAISGGGSVTTSGKLSVGDQAANSVAMASLTISGGGSLLSSAQVTEVFAGTINISDIDSSWTIGGSLEFFTSNRPATMTISGGGVVSTTLSASIRGSNGTVLVDGANSTWDVGNSLYVGGGSGGPGGGGLVTVSGGGSVNVTNTLKIWSPGTLIGGNITAGQVVNSGIVKPGNSPGVLSITGAYNQEATGKLQIEIGGMTTGTQYDTLDISGAVFLAGTLQVSLIDLFIPSLGNTFQILTAGGGITGTFATTLLPALDGNLTWNVLYETNSVSLRVWLPGDFNFDGTVDTADYVVWRKNGLAPEAFNTWRANFGEPAGGGSGASANAAIPEPTTLVMLIVAVVGIRLRRRHIA